MRLPSIAVCVGVLLCSSAWANEPLSLNQASADDLMALDHVDAALAGAIVGLRGERGTLTSVDQLRVLPGISAMALHSLRAGTAVTWDLPIGDAKTYSRPEDVLAEFAHEPTIQQVQLWANEYARTSPDMVRGWMNASKGFAALPEVTFEYYLKDDWGQGFDYVPEQASNDLVAELKDADKGQDQRFMVRARWKLGELVMSSNRIRIINEAQDAVKLRDKMLTQVTRMYFDRRRHQVEMLLNPRSGLQGQVEDQLRLMELGAGIDALTGGNFSTSLYESQAK